MSSPDRSPLVTALLDRHGHTYADELGIDLAAGTPSALFRWLCAAILYSARISAKTATKAARALADAGWTTPDKMAASTWAQRVRVLNEAGYARYDESTARRLGEDVDMLRDKYGGDLRQLRAAAHHDPAAERRLLKEFKGLGDVGVDIFFREVQVAWDELYPFADTKALTAARTLGLGHTAADLAGLVGRADFPRLVAALVRTDLGKDYEGVRAQAAGQ